MFIQCTKKLLDQMNMKPSPSEEGNTLFSWHANLITLNRRKTVVLMNDKNRYIIVLYGLKAKDFKNMDNLILDAVREAFRNECIDEEIIEDFINESKEITYGKTKDRSTVSKLNNACDMAQFEYRHINEGAIFQNEVGSAASRFITGDGIRPGEELYRDLEFFSGRCIFRCRAVQLKVTLDLENHKVWRRLVIPLNATFTRLHKILQEAFGWKDYHIHEFYIYENESEKVWEKGYINHPGYIRDGRKPFIKLVSNEEAFAYPDEIEMKYEYGVKLSEYIPQCKDIKYIYDFGDNWQHYIEVEKIIEDYDRNYPVCPEGEGNTPPEDVGGQSGYEEFLYVMAHKNHPEYEGWSTWAESQEYKDFDIDRVNRNIKSGYRW